MDQLRKEHFLKIIGKYYAGSASKEELEFLDAYYQAFGMRGGYPDDLDEEKRLLLKNELKNSIGKNISTYQEDRFKKGKGNILRWSISAAAAILFIAGFGLFYYPQKRIPAPIANNIIENDIVPGGNKAVLTLSNGKKISLTDAENGTLAEQTGVQITKTADGQLVYTILSDVHLGSNAKDQNNTIETPKGGRYQVRLPDGSNVWLNAASRLTFPSSFTSQKNRRVELYGEAYFEVAKDKAHPFIVKTVNQEVMVLGTHFNINSYVDEPDVKTTLLEGSIRVTENKGIEKILKPGQQSTLTSKGLKIENVDTDMAVAWKKNQFVFESDDIQYIMRMISRWYNVEVEYEGTIPKNKFGGAVSRFENVSEVLKSLESTGRVKFRIEGRRIFVSK